MLDITKQISSYNNSSRNGNSIKYIVIHDVGAKSTAKNNAIYFGGGNRNASANYFVDDTSIYQVVEDNRAAWHCGDGAGAYGITNSNSIGIEMCLPSGDVTETTEANTIELVKYLMSKYNIAADKVVRHYDASKKSCPNTFKANSWARWTSFKNKLTGSSEVAVENKPTQINNWIARLQEECNKQGFSSQVVDGIAGKNTLAGCPTLRKGASGNITKLLQEKLDVTADGIFGLNTKAAVIGFQNAHKLVADGIVGQNTWKKLLGM